MSVDGTGRGPRDEVTAIGDRLDRDPKTVRIAGGPDVPLVVALPIRVEHLDLAAFGIGRLAEHDPHLGWRLHQSRIGVWIRADIVGVGLRSAAHEDGTAEDAR